MSLVLYVCSGRLPVVVSTSDPDHLLLRSTCMKFKVRRNSQAQFISETRTFYIYILFWTFVVIVHSLALCSNLNLHSL